MKVMIYNEYAEHQKRGKILKAYPNGLHNAIKEIFDKTDIVAKTCTLTEPEHGLSQKVLDSTDVLIWWGHCLHEKVDDVVVDRIVKRVDEGMGIIFLHSAHFSKPFKRLLGASGSLRWREANEPCRIWTLTPTHPIATGVKQGFRLKKEEMYGEPFDIPKPDDIIFASWFKGGDIFRSGCTFTYGKGKIFYLQCGHETFPAYYDANVRKIIYNATLWTANIEIKNDFVPNTKCIHSGLPCERIRIFSKKEI